MHGAEVIRDEVVLKLKDKRLAAFSVYIPMVLGDSKKPAIEAAKGLEKADIKSFWDGKRELGKAYATVVELPKGRTVAWDIYFVYGPDAVWGTTPPKPVYWMHQLGEDDKCLDGAKVRAAVRKELKAMKPAKHLVFLSRDGCAGTAAMLVNEQQTLRQHLFTPFTSCGIRRYSTEKLLPPLRVLWNRGPCFMGRAAAADERSRIHDLRSAFYLR